MNAHPETCACVQCELAEARFMGTTFVYRGPYPRSVNGGEEHAPEVIRQRRAHPKTNVEGMVEREMAS